jgi:hypothetical protein
MATRNMTMIKELNTDEASYQIYDRNGRVFISELQGKVLRRLKVHKHVALLLIAYPSPSTIIDRCKLLLDEAQKRGSSDFYTVKTT